eukprot:2513098-Pyramimonas_sp.AAC.1
MKGTSYRIACRTSLHVALASRLPSMHTFLYLSDRVEKPQMCSGERTALGISEAGGSLLAMLNDRQGVARHIPVTRPELTSFSRASITPSASRSRPLWISTSSDEMPHLATALPTPTGAGKDVKEDVAAVQPGGRGAETTPRRVLPRSAQQSL